VNYSKYTQKTWWTSFWQKKEILNSAARSNTITPYLHVAGYYFTSVLDTIFWMNLLLVAFVSTQYFFNWHKTGSWSISCLEVRKKYLTNQRCELEGYQKHSSVLRKEKFLMIHHTKNIQCKENYLTKTRPPQQCGKYWNSLFSQFWQKFRECNVSIMKFMKRWFHEIFSRLLQIWEYCSFFHNVPP